MKKIITGISLAVAVALFALNCATASGMYHGGFMKGSVASATGSEGVICIGSKDGAQVGL